MIRIGLLGASRIAPGALIAPAGRREDCVITCVAARDQARAEAFAAAHGIESAAAGYETLIRREDVDLVYNALPPSRHADLSIAALEAGKHVLCEKPFAMNAPEARAMADAAARTGCRLIEAFHYRFHPVFLHLLEAVRSGVIGRLCALKAEFSVAIAYRPDELRHRPDLGGGAMMDLGCYAAHWLRTIAGSEPEVIGARMEEGMAGIDLMTEAELRFEGRVPARLRTSMKRGQRFKALLAIEGSEGLLIADNPIHPGMGHLITLRRGAGVRRYTIDGQTTFDHQLAHVVDVIHGRAEPLTGGADAVANMALIDAIYAAGGLSPRGH